MNTGKLRGLMVGMLVLLYSGGTAWAGMTTLQSEAATALKQAMAKLGGPTDIQNMICLTNAGYAMVAGKGTQPFCKIVRDACGISADTGNILRVHTAFDAPLYFALAHKTSPSTLPLVMISQTGNTFTVGKPMDVYVKKGMRPEALKPLGSRAFSVVSIVNGWANGFPDDLLQGALYHDHLCGGVSTGFLTVDYIKKYLPLSENQHYTYIGTPAWCQDDYIATAMNLTPGKRGYVSMRYSWEEVWKTADNEYTSLGGLVIRYDEKSQKGDATLLKFDWRRDDFARFVNDPGMDLKDRRNPLLHVYMSRFFLADRDHPEKFLSIVTTKPINSQADLDRLVAVGANPLEAMLGPRLVSAK